MFCVGFYIEIFVFKPFNQPSTTMFLLQVTHLYLKLLDSISVGVKGEIFMKKKRVSYHGLTFTKGNLK